MPSGPNRCCAANAVTFSPVAFCSTRCRVCTAALLYAQTVPGRRRLAQADRIRGAIAGDDQPHVVGEQAPLAPRVHAEEVADRDRGGRSAPPLRDPPRRAVADAEVAVVLCDSHEGAGERLRRREHLLRGVRTRAVEVPLAGELAVADDDEAVRLPGPRLRGDPIELRGVEPDARGRDLVPRVAGGRRVTPGRTRERECCQERCSEKTDGSSRERQTGHPLPALFRDRHPLRNRCGDVDGDAGHAVATRGARARERRVRD